jgi:type I restriction enzyme, S subunit
MSKDKNSLIPKFRFPEFVNEGEWEGKTVGQVYDFKITNSFPREYLNYENGYVKNIHYGDIHTKFNTLFDIQKEKVPYLNEGIAINKIKEDSYCIEGDIIFADASEDLNDVGKSIEIVNLNNEKLVSGLHTLLARQRESKLIIGFGGYLFKSNSVRKRIQSEAQGAKVLGISATRISSIKISYPKNPEEQQKIASCLSSLDEVITAYSQKLDLLKDHKKGLMQNLFPQEGEKVPKYRFPEFMKDGEWVKKTLIDTVDKKVRWSFTGGPFGSNLKASNYTTKGIRIIQLQNIGEGEFNDDYKIYTSEEKADELLSCNIYSGEIILSKMGDPVGRACIIPDYLERCLMASDGIRLVVDEKKNSKYFIYSLINSKRIREAIEKKATGSTRKRIGLDELKLIELTMPKTFAEQQKVAECILGLDNLITEHSKKVEELKLHKKGLMQGLFPK